MALEARDASRILGASGREARDGVLRRLARMLVGKKEQLLLANQGDVARAREAGLPPAVIDRVGHSDSAFTAMVEGLVQIADAPDPIGA